MLLNKSLIRVALWIPAPPTCMSKCPWARYWTPNWHLAWWPLSPVTEFVSRFGHKRLLNDINVNVIYILAKSPAHKQPSSSAFDNMTYYIFILVAMLFPWPWYLVQTMWATFGPSCLLTGRSVFHGNSAVILIPRAISTTHHSFMKI